MHPSITPATEKGQPDLHTGNFPRSTIFGTSSRDGPIGPCYLSPMNARWGFDLDMSAIRLMRREGGRWQEVARENIDGPDIEDRLVAMIERIEGTNAVDLFLPRDQILYTDVKVSGSDEAEAEIFAAMEGRTPYSLGDLVIDWVLEDREIARVAAIARETLDEAAAFAETRGLVVTGFSSLAGPDDFPRLPSFGDGPDFETRSTGLDMTSEGSFEVETLDVPVSFTSVRDPRKVSVPPPVAHEPASAVPVLQVDDATPVVQVKANPLPPLNPGKPLVQPLAAPRVRTDIAAGTLSGGVAASLTPSGPSIRVRAPATNSQRTLAIFVVAAILTVGIAAIVWAILPLAPGRSTVEPPTAAETGLNSESGAPEQSIVAAPSLPDAPQPTVSTEFSSLAETPAPDAAPESPVAISAGVNRTGPVDLPSAVQEGGLPNSAALLEPRPASLVGLPTEAPVQGLDGSEDATETTDDIYIASIERRDLAFDAIALPRAVAADQVPVPEAPPAAAGAPEQVASVDPTATLPQSEADAPQAPENALVTRSEAVEGEELPSPAESADVALRPTALAAALPDRAPRARPGGFTAAIERQQFGGMTRAELAAKTPPRRPDSAQVVARESEPIAEASELAVASSAPPRGRPSDFDAVVAAAVVQARSEQITASLEFETPDTSSAIEAALAEDAEPEPRPQDTPRLAIPSTASVSRQATIENAIPLNKINLVGVYGVPSDRRALIRLSNGRYVKVKVGDRVDGGTVAQISDSELVYRKGSRNFSLALPKG